MLEGEDKKFTDFFSDGYFFWHFDLPKSYCSEQQSPNNIRIDIGVEKAQSANTQKCTFP
jgi:hypothetical protein